jgi:NarL family two-component system response regulator LiaR
MAQTALPDVIVLDLSMPVMNGLEAARILGQQMPAIPVIMFTSFCTPGIEREMLAAGVTKVIPKTGPLSDLIENIRCLAKEAA